MTELSLYRVYCTTDKEFKHVWNYSTPTECPTHNDNNVNIAGINKIKAFNNYKQIFSSDSPFTLTNYNLYICDTTNGNITCNLYFNDSFNIDRFIIIIKRGNSNTLTIVPQNNKLINDLTSLFLNANNSFVCLNNTEDGTWNSVPLNNISYFTLNKIDLVNENMMAGIKGSLLVHNGKEVINIPPGNDGKYLMAKSDSTFGIQWGDVSSSSSNIFIGDAVSVSNTESTYKLLYRFIFPGSTTFNLVFAKVLCDTNSQTGSLRLYDHGSNTVMCENTNVSGTYHIETLSPITNVPKDQSIIEVHGIGVKCFGCLLSQT